MLTELQSKWLATLRSGEFKQGKSYLRSKEDYYCCLGVGAHLCDPNGWEPLDDQHAYTHKIGGSGINSQYLNAKGCAQLGITSAFQDRLAKMNDTGSTFAEIADAIEDFLNNPNIPHTITKFSR